MKDSYYFSHDTNAFLDPKIRIIISEFGVWSYGMFWVIIEMLASQREYKTELKYLASSLYPLMQGKKVIYKSESGLGYFIDDSNKNVDDEDVGCLSICLAKVEALLEMMLEVKLLETDNDKKWVWSNSLNERMAKKEELSEKRKFAGHLGGIARSKHLLSKCGSKIKQGKERKGKEIKESNTTQDLISSLKTNPAYKDIDIDRELAKMDAWLLTRPGRTKTKRFVVNWLNKVDRPIENLKQNLKSPDKNCRICKGDGQIYAPGSGKLVVCECRIK